MSDKSPVVDDLEVGLRDPSFCAPFILWRLAAVTVGFAILWLSVYGAPGLHSLKLATALFVGAYAPWLFFRVWWVAHRGGLPPITLTGATVTAPINALSRRTCCISLADIRSVVVIGRGWRARLVIDAGRRRPVFPLSLLNAPDAAEQLRFALRRNLLAAPDGQASWDKIETRHDLADAVGHVRPLGSLCFAAVAGLAFAAQTALLSPQDSFGLLHAGANSPLMLRTDQWFRPVAANLLHANPVHLFGDLAILLCVGTILERLAGKRRLLILLLAGGIAAQLAGAAIGAKLHLTLFSVGFSGALSALLAALGVITWRYRRALPGGVRLPGPIWALSIVFLGAMPMLLRHVDALTEVAGALAGLVLGGLLCWRCADIYALRRAGLATNLIGGALLAAWCAGGYADLRHVLRPLSRSADIALLAYGMVASGGYAAQQANRVAWELARDPDASPEVLGQAAELATRAVAGARRDDPHGTLAANATDTLATLRYRIGDAQRAVTEELPVLATGPAFSGHFALFLDRMVREHGVQVIGQSATRPPSVELGQGVMQLADADPWTGGGSVYAVLRRHDAVAGLLVVHVPRGFSGAQILPLPSATGAPSTKPPPPLWTDGASEIQVALVDRRDCLCKEPKMGPFFEPVTAESALPSWRVTP